MSEYNKKNHLNITITLNIFLFILTILSLFYIYLYETSINIPSNDWFQKYWQISFLISIIYLLTIFMGQTIMRNNSPFDLRITLFIWNLSLALFSICGTIKITNEMIQLINEKGIYYTYCDNSYINKHTVYLWYYFFVVSKVVELGDTIFVVIRKQKLQLIHWTHHIITLIYSFYISAHLPAIGRWMSSMNFFVHSIMYTYYAMKSLRINIHKLFPRTVTFLQIAQMFIGVTISMLALYDKLFVGNCENGGLTAFWGTVMYLFYCYMFVKLFFNHYIKQTNK
jgi:elongation of very long chain fatty acids protein 6